MKKITLSLFITKSGLQEEVGKIIEWDIFFTGEKPKVKELSLLRKEIMEDLYPCTRHNINDEGYNHFDMSDLISSSVSIKTTSNLTEKDLKTEKTYFLDRNYEDGKFMLLPSSFYTEKSMLLKDVSKVMDFVVKTEKSVLEEFDLEDFKTDELSVLEARYLYNQYMFYMDRTSEYL